MKVKDKISGQVFNVYGIYWHDVYGIYWHDNKTYFYAFPKNSGGISSFGEEEVEIVERAIDDDFEFVRTDEKISGFFHRYLLVEGLMDGLLEHDPSAYKKFVSLIGKVP